ncbi:MAG: hypothetical protein EWM72_00815 [Nitrospira sp.]|nr:MAG: hypothetical protein EWM72_00815 [Nitrospira sp.]
MSKLRQTKDGLLIPSSLLKGLTGPVSVQREGNVLFIESEQRRTARRRVARMVQRLRQAAKGLKNLTTATIAREVAAVRRKRAGHR